MLNVCGWWWGEENFLSKFIKFWAPEKYFGGSSSYLLKYGQKFVPDVLISDVIVDVV